MRLRTVILGLGAIVLAAAIATPIILVPGTPVSEIPVAEPVPADEQAAIIAALAPPKRERPVIAIITRNDGTEVSDFLSVYGMLKRSGVADVYFRSPGPEIVAVRSAVGGAGSKAISGRPGMTSSPQPSSMRQVSVGSGNSPPKRAQSVEVPGAGNVTGR